MLKEVKKQLTHVKDDISIIKENCSLVKSTYICIDQFRCVLLRNLSFFSSRWIWCQQGRLLFIKYSRQYARCHWSIGVFR